MSKNHKNKDGHRAPENNIRKEESGMNAAVDDTKDAKSIPDNEEEVVEDIIDSPETEIEALKELLQNKEAEIQKEKKNYLFLMADFDNFRKRTLKEKSDLIKTGSENILKQLLPVVDDFERGLEAMKTAADADALKEGMELVYNKFLKFFEQNGVKVMDTTGKEFDPDQHEALTIVPVENPEQKNKIVDTVTKGYTLNDKVIRHAKVVVGS